MQILAMQLLLTFFNYFVMWLLVLKINLIWFNNNVERYDRSSEYINTKTILKEKQHLSRCISLNDFII